MGGFYTRFAVATLLGSALVWHAVPLLRPVVEQRFGPPGEAVVASAPAETPSLAAPTPETPTARLTAPRAEPARPAEADDAHRSDQPTAAAPTPPPPPIVEPAPPVVPPAPPVRVGPRYDWGIVAETTSSYSSAGQVIGKLAGGTVVERISRHESSVGPLARCRVLNRQAWQDGFFVPDGALVMFQGSFDDAPPAERDHLVRYFTLRAQIADRRAEFRDRAIRSNPHFAAYQTAAKALTAHSSEAQDLAARRDSATGPERSRLDDRLRRLKSREAGLRHAFRQAEGPYKRWRASNDDGSVAIASDAQINAWERELAALEPSVRSMLRGL